MKKTIICFMIGMVALVFFPACASQKKPTSSSSETNVTSRTTHTTSSSSTRSTTNPTTKATTKLESTKGLVSTSSAASPIAGLWTDDPSGMVVTIDERGLPVGDIYEGEWYSFRTDGTFFRLFYNSGVAVSGILIQEGIFKISKNSIILTKCTESYFRDLWDEQPEYYRVPIENRTLQYRLAQLQGQSVIYITSPVRNAEQLYFQARK